MTLTSYYNMDLSCRNCGNPPNHRWPACNTHIMWSNQHGAGVRVFCQKCKHYTDMKSVSGVITVSESKPVDWSIPSWNWARDNALVNALTWTKLTVEREQKIAKGAFTVRMPLDRMVGRPNKESIELMLETYDIKVHRVEKFDGETITLILI